MKSTLAIISLLNLFFISNIKAQFLSEKLNGYIPVTTCHANDITEKISIPPPKDFLLKDGNAKKSEINVTYSLFPPEAMAAFDYAIGIWETIIKSDIPINVQANWRTMGGSTLGSAAPADYVTNFKNIPQKNRYYPLALAEKLAGEPLNSSSSPDIVCTFNKDFKWYYKTDQDTPAESYDFVTVVLHEIAHGLGFTGFFTVRNNLGLYEYNFNSIDGLATAFDLMVVNGADQYLVDTSLFEVPSVGLYNALTSNLYSKSQSAAFENNDISPMLYTPGSWDGGSSVYHLNDATYPPISGNSLMTHGISKGESVHDPGPLALGILDDIGWKYIIVNLESPKDMEQIKPIVFNVTVDSDNELDTASLFVVYSNGSPANFSNTVPLVYNNESGFFTATILPENNGGYFYYISIKDIKERVFRLPEEAPENYFTITVGPDLEKPVVVHIPVPYFITTESEIPLTAYVYDNLGVDSVYIEYSINNIPQQSFGLFSDSITLYKGIFPINTDELHNGDVITYRIIATDSAQIQNFGTSPSEGFYSFEVFDPVREYFNDFNSSSSDFTLTDFDINQEPDFANGALNSQHPYPNTNQFNVNFNFSTMLIHPVILKENALMSYDEVVLVEPGEDPFYEDADFWDYVIVEGSKDNGKTWLPLIDGYDSRENSTWLTNYNLNIINQVSQAAGTSDWYVRRQFNMLESGNFAAGDTILIRFRLFSDQLANGWGWCIDNLSIQSPLSVAATALSPGNVLIYPNPFNDEVNISITLKKPIDLVEIEFYNLYGQKIYSQQYDKATGKISENIDLSNQPAGLYLINVKENGINVLSKKVVKR